MAKKSLILVVALVLMVTACNSTSEKTIVSTEITIPATDTPVSPTVTPTEISTETNTPQPQNPVVVNWPTQDPALTDFERDALLVEYLSVANQCELPCFWNIFPGNTNRDIANTLEPIIFHHANLSQKLTNGQFYHQHQIKIYGGIYPKQEIVFSPSNGSIVFHFYSQQAELKLASYTFSDDMRSISNEHILDGLLVYDLPQIINQYGTPDKIKIGMSYQNQVAYSIYLRYEQFNSIIVYDGLAALSDPIEICPTIGNNPNGRITGIRFYVSSVETFSLIEDVIPELPLGSRYLKDIENLGQSNETFMDIFSSEDAQPKCIFISQSEWEE